MDRSTTQCRVTIELQPQEEKAIKEGELATTNGHGVKPYIERIIREHLKSLGYKLEGRGRK